jgi:hypothetical protein
LNSPLILTHLTTLQCTQDSLCVCVWVFVCVCVCVCVNAKRGRHEAGSPGRPIIPPLPPHL